MPLNRLLLACSVLSITAAGCAQGGGALVDAGPGARMDGGGGADGGGDRDAGADAGPPPGFDAGAGTDAGPAGSDAGPPTVDAGPPAADAGPPAVDARPPPGCTSSAECSDGLGCNGTERCVGGTCMPGTPFICDDGISCTRDTCVEGASPSCRFTPDDALCAAGETCTGTGCAAMCAETPCRLVSPQCGCPAGQMCAMAGTSRICTTSGITPVGSTCSGAFSCVPGSICINVARSGPAVTMCNRYCDTDSQCAGGLCIYTLDDGSGGSVPGVTICSTPCDPVAQTGCPSGTACQIFREAMGAMRFFTDCAAPVGAGGRDAGCTSSEDCRAGYGCIGSPGRCLQWCDGVGLTGSAAGCPIGLTCYPFTTPVVIGGTEYGVCDS